MPFRNIETHFSQAPSVEVKRSAFKYNKRNTFTMNAGDLVPFLVEEVLPGDTFSINLSKVLRLSTSLHPTMDNLYVDTYFFFVPNRFAWDNWTKFMGENDKKWTQTTEFVPPKLAVGGTSGSFGSTYRYGSVEPQSLLQYLMLPAFANSSKKSFDVSALCLNAYCKIWNDWFRSENLIDEVPFYTGDGYIPQAYLNAYGSFMSNNFGINVDMKESNSCLKVAKFADYFTRALPQPQKGADVLIPAGGDVVLSPEYRDLSSAGQYPFFQNASSTPGTASGSLVGQGAVGSQGPSITDAGGQAGFFFNPNGSLTFEGLEITVNNLILATQTQRLLERDARSGTRYIEIIKGHFGVISPDLRLQRSEYLGGKRSIVNMAEVIQTAQGTNPLGSLAGRSITSGIDDCFTKSFTEHGFIIGCCCVRPDRTYSQGVERMFTRFNRLDYYFPVLANIGEQGIKNKEIYLTDLTENVEPDEIFGYQEAWAEYRTQRSRQSGYMQPGITGTLDSWNYGDSYQSTPVLSPEWLYQGKNEIDRTLAVTSAVAPQFICDFLCYGKVVRPMPVYSIPGLLDHN